MFELSGTISDIAAGFMNVTAEITLTVNEKAEVMKLFDTYGHKEKLTVKIDKYREKRSKKANAYFWELCGKLAEALSKEGVKYTKEDIYRDAIKEIGIFRDDEISPEDVSWRRTAWERLGTGWVTERVDYTPDGQKEIIRFYYGSSQYNTTQMSRLINNIVQDCQAVGIETKTPDEIANMLNLWEAEKWQKA